MMPGTYRRRRGTEKYNRQAALGSAPKVERGLPLAGGEGPKSLEKKVYFLTGIAL
jgi:hypothetical protein